MLIDMITNQRGNKEALANAGALFLFASKRNIPYTDHILLKKEKHE